MDIRNTRQLSEAITELLLISVECFLLLFVSFDLIWVDLVECGLGALMPLRVLGLYGALPQRQWCQW